MTGSGMRATGVGRQQSPHRSHVTGCVRGIPSSAGQTHGPGTGSGRRRKGRIPLLEELGAFWDVFRTGMDKGLLLERRAVAEGREEAPLRGASLPELIGAYRSRCERTNAKTATERVRVRNGVLRDAGGLIRNDRACGRRVRKLYLSGKYFGCRHCHDLTYRSTQESDSRVYAALRSGMHLGGFANIDRMSVSQLGFALKVLTAGEKRLERIGKQMDKIRRNRHGNKGVKN